MVSSPVAACFAFAVIAGHVAVSQEINYVLGFARSNIPTLRAPNAVLYISTQDHRGANVTVEIPLARAQFEPSFPMHFRLQQFETRQVKFPTRPDLDIRVSTERDRGIHVISHNGAKLDIVGVNNEVRSTDSFLVFPCKLENEIRDDFFTSEYKYFIFSAYSADYRSAFLIIPCTEGGATSTGIQYTIPGESSETIGSLFQYETFLVTSENDLTGTVITSPQPLAVFATHLCGVIPKESFSCDQIVEQIPPDVTYGTKFLVLPFSIRESGDILRIGSTIDNNDVFITCARSGPNVELQRHNEIINSGKFVNYRTRERSGNPATVYQRDYCSIETSKPAIVMQYMLGHGEDSVTFESIGQLGDPSMTLVPPVEQYTNSYIISTPDEYLDSAHSTYFSFIGWAVPAQFFSGDNSNLLLNNTVLSPTDRESGGSGGYIPIFCNNSQICGYGGTGRISAGTSKVSYRSLASVDAKVYVSVYGLEREISYAYPAGMKCDPIGLPKISSYDVFATEGVNGSVRIKFTRTGYLGVRTRIRASTVESAEGGAVAGTDVGSDFIPVVNRKVRFDINSTNPKVTDASFDITILDDDVRETTEYFEVIFYIDSQPNSGGYAFPSSVARVTILDDDGVPECSFVSVDYTAVEAENRFVVIEVEATDVDAVSDSCRLSTESASATSGTDYTEFEGPVVFHGPLATVQIPIVDDNVGEFEEIFKIRLTSDVSNVLIAGPDVATVHIISDDVVRFGFNISQHFVSESDAQVDLVINKLGVTDHDTSINVATLKGTAVSDSDYMSLFEVVTFLARETSKNVSVSIREDVHYELEEQFTVLISESVSVPFIAFDIGPLATTTVNIMSNDVAIVEFEQHLYTVREGDGEIAVCIVVIEPPASADLMYNITVDYGTERITAGSSDFQTSFGSLTFPQSNSSSDVRKQCSTITIFEDNIYETIESFMVYLVIPLRFSSAGLISNNSKAEVSVLDDEKLLIGFVDQSFQAHERAETARVRFEILNDALTAVEVHINLVVLGSDHREHPTVASKMYVFNSSATSFNFDFEFDDDNVFEVNESYPIRLRFFGETTVPRVTLAPAQATIEIMDDDRPVSCFPTPGCHGNSSEQAPESDCCRHGKAPFGLSYVALESGPGVRVCTECPVEFGFFQRTIAGRESLTPYRVPVGFLSGRSEFGGVRIFTDYIAGSATQEDDVIVTSTEVNVHEDQPSIVEMLFRQDGIALEMDETFTLRFTFEAGAFGSNPVLINSLEGTVIDADKLLLGIREDQRQVIEKDILELNLTNGQLFEVNITLILKGIDLSAEGSSDYKINGMLPFTINAEKPTISIEVINDNFFELEELLLVQLSFFGPPPPRVNITTEEVIITIVDDDSLEFFFEDPVLYAIEGVEDLINVTLCLNGDPGNLTVLLFLSASDTSATAGVDYDFSAPALEFSNSVSSHTITIGIIDDDFIEYEEQLHVFVANISIRNSSGKELYLSDEEHKRIHTEKHATIVIRDDIQFVFAESFYSVSEGESEVILEIVKQGFASGNTSVLFFTEEDSASSVNNTDFVAIYRELLFSENEKETLVSIGITDDDLVEGNERFLAVLSEVSEASDVVMAVASVTVTIEDNDAVSTMTTVSSDVSTFLTLSPPSQVLEISLSVIFGTLLLTFIVIILMVLCLLCRKKHSKKDHDLSIGESSKESISESNDYVHRLRHFTVQTSYKLNIPNSLFIPSCNLKLGMTIGQGEFGVVYKGYLKASASDIVVDTVAVKTLKGFVQHDLVRDLLKECGRMYKFNHPNVLTLLGVCMDGGPAPFIIMPYMANGSLSAYLKKERGTLLLDPESTSLEDTDAVKKKLFDICIQIAKGMEYLASKRVIHRDLAARNCMIDVSFVIKVADFGLAESIDSSKDYFRQSDDNIIKLPVKWLALESINDGVFSEKSDVWSYGVTCWEVFSGGKSPYPGIHPADLPQKLDRGWRLEKPFNAACTDEIYAFMLECWSADANLRPTFATLVVQLSGLLGGMAEYLDVSVAVESETK